MLREEQLETVLKDIQALCAPGQTLGLSQAIDLICDVYNRAKNALDNSKSSA